MPQPSPIQLFYWPTPNGWKVSIALEEMGLPYEVRPVNISKGEQFQKDFLSISPNNRMPAITDPDGPDGKPISVFESGAILQYLGRKSGKFYGKDERARAEVEQWLMWQMAGLGPMSGQAGHFRMAGPMVDDPAQLAYGVKRYTNEVNRLYGVMDKRLADRPFLAGEYSIADMAAWPWTKLYGHYDQKLEDFPNLKVWFETVAARPAVQRGIAVGADLPKANAVPDAERLKVLFNQTAKSIKS
jgi:GSH-dependent disulfide-bond oxidoreductase